MLPRPAAAHTYNHNLLRKIDIAFSSTYSKHPRNTAVEPLTMSIGEASYRRKGSNMPSSRNAVTHGIHTSVVALRNENDAEYRRIDRAANRLAALREKRAPKEAQASARQRNAQILQNETKLEKAA